MNTPKPAHSDIPKKCNFGYKCCRRWSNCQYLHSYDEERQEAETNDDNDEKLNKAEMIGDSKIEVHDDDTLEYEEGSDKSDEETIESIMAKAKAFEVSDESDCC